MDKFLDKYIVNGSDNWFIDSELLQILEDEIELWKQNNPDKDPDKDRNLKGRLGEIYVRECLKKQLYGHGFKYSYSKTKPMTFRMRYQYPRANAIDIYLRIVDDKCKVYRIFIEVCNWGKYHNINGYMFLTRIQFKFARWDYKDKYYHIVAINHRNVKLIKNKTSEVNMDIIPLREHITPSFIKRIKDNNMYKQEWIDGFKAGRKYK